MIEYQKLESKEARQDLKQAREAARLHKHFVLKLTSEGRKWLQAEVARAQADQHFTAEQAIADTRANVATLGSLSDADIMAIAFIVMMEATKSAQEDLKSIMDGVKLINKQKDGWRKVQDTVNKLSADSVSNGANSSGASSRVTGPCGVRPCGSSSTVLSPGLLEDNPGFSRQGPAAAGTGAPAAPAPRSFGIR
jgi:hypothetical protein